MADDSGHLQTDLTGQVCLVTGGGRGLGRAFAQSLANAGASVAVVARSEEQIEETATSIGVTGGRAVAIRADVTNQQDVESMVATVERQLGPVDLLVNDAGVATPLGPSWEVDPDEWWRCLECNLRGPFLCSRAVLPHMVSRRRGRIINVVSTGGLRAIPFFAAYSTSKAALIRYSETLAGETRPHGIQVFAIHPGLVRTALTEYLAESPEGQQWVPWVREVLATGRDNPATDAVNLVLFLASGRGDSLTGRFLNVEDDIAHLVEQQAEIAEDDLYTLRLRISPWVEREGQKGTRSATSCRPSGPHA